MKKFLIVLMVLCLNIPVFAFAGCKTQEINTNTQETEETAATGYTVTFDCDENVSVLVYYTHDYSGDGEATTTAYSRNDETGEKTADGTGQVNFKVVLAEGYVISNITATEGTYKNIKSSVETGEDNIYRITKITADTTITITTAKVDEITAYTATFNVEDGLSVLVGYDNQEQSFARDGDNGTILTDGTGQINFVVLGDIPEDKEISVVVTGTYKNLKDLSITEGIENYYRVTKVQSDLTITISLIDKTE